MKKLASYIPLYQNYQKGRALSAQSRDRSFYYLRRFSRWLGDMDVRDISLDTFLSYKEYLADLETDRGTKLKPISVEHHFSVLKDFFSYLYRCDLLLTNPAENLKVNLTKGRGKRPFFTGEEINLFLDTIDIKTAIGQRDRALFELIYSSGLRSFEAAGLLVKQMNLDERICLVKGKGEKERYVPFSQTACRFLVSYMKKGRRKLVKEINNREDQCYVFLSSTGKISWSVMGKRFHDYLEESGLKDKGYTIHSIRHATASHLLENGASVRYVQELLGHRSLKTTQIYTRPTEKNVRGVYRTYHPRENEYFREVDTVYLEELRRLKEEIQVVKEENRRKRERRLIE